MKRISLYFSLLGSLVPVAPMVAADASVDGFNKVVKPFFDQHCTSCHGEKKKKGDLRVDTLEMNFDSPKVMGHWMEIMERINSGDMPPEDEKRPDPNVIGKVAEWITERLNEAEVARQFSDKEKVSFRRLSREEYANTVRDLLGVTYDVTDPTGLPEDPDWHGFQRIGSVLTLSPAHVEKYMLAAEAILNEALSLEAEPKREVTHWSPFDIRGWKGFEKDYEERGMADKVRVDIVPNNGALDSRDFQVKTGGEYIVRIKTSGLRPEGGRAPRLRLYASSVSRLLFEQDIDAPEDKPVTIEFRTHLPAGKHPIRIVNAVAGPNPEARRSRASGTPNIFTGLKSRVPWQMKFTDDDGKAIIPFLLLDYIEWEGPIVDSWPTAAHQRIFFKGPDATKDLAYAREIISRFAERAWRRPAQADEVDRMVKVVEQAQKLGDNFEVSVKAALLTVLCSKNFIYLQEGNIAKPTQQLNDYELASRLSYFLWSTMPDQALLDLAGKGKLHEKETLRAEVRRMLKDPKAAKFADSFPRQWLQLRMVGMFAPDGKLYPEYDEYLEKSMIAETTGFFDEVLRKNLSLREFITSDWTMLNARLAEHYGIEGVKGETLQRVSLKPEDHRGGLLTQGSILSMTSDGTRHRPVHRGKWLLESFIGKPPPPPPANVPAIETAPPTAPKTSLRAKLEAHKSDPNCAACHLKIDPLGLAFENYDAIGRWRTEEALKEGAGENPKIDASGELNDGRKFADANGLKQILLHDTDKFAAACTEKLATYAMRRAPNFGDRNDLKHITELAKADDYKIMTLIESFVTSDLFQKR